MKNKSTRPTLEAMRAMTPQERADRADELVPGLRGAARQVWVETGRGGWEQSQNARLERERREAFAEHERRSNAGRLAFQRRAAQ